ncbi:MAG: hypothetical protein HY329_01680 [Chloroflexi bacterium]|nr:hypothetical protein [Chloroflexota bacterium]
MTAVLSTYVTRRGYYVRLEDPGRCVYRETGRFWSIVEAKAAFPQITSWCDPGPDADLDVVAIAALTSA